MTAADLDGDGDSDVLFSTSERIGWYENLDGRGTFGRERRIARGETAPYESVVASDFDMDGDFDIVVSSYTGLFWLENDSLGAFTEEHLISDSVSSFYNIDVGDLDGDGRLDVVATDGTNVFLFSDDDGIGEFGVSQILSVGIGRISSMFARDLDADGDLDVVLSTSTSRTTNAAIVWLENLNTGNDFRLRQVDSSDVAFSFTFQIFVADLDSDGDDDILSNSTNGEFVWYENQDSAKTFQTRAISRSGYTAQIYAADLDGDQDLDALSVTGPDSVISWFENVDGAGNFSVGRVVSDERFRGTLYSDDFDSDGVQDLLTVDRLTGSVGWYDKVDNAETTFLQYPVSAAKASRYLGFCGCLSVEVGDIDGDGDLDLATSSYNAYYGVGTFYWHENTDGFGTFSRQQAGLLDIPGAEDLATGDVDQDGDLDIVTNTNGRIALHLNDSDGRFTSTEVAEGQKRVLDGSATILVDLDNDDDLDLLYETNQGVAWRKNIGGVGIFGEELVVSNTPNARGWPTQGTRPVDFDGDGDQDLVSVAFDDAELRWYENIDGLGNFSSPRRLVRLDRGDTFSFGDVDGDRDYDLIIAKYESRDVVWYENRDSQMVRAATIADHELEVTTTSIEVADIDGDGDMDVITAETYELDQKIVWYENLDGAGARYQRHVLYTDLDASISGWRSFVLEIAYVGDADSDGDIDIISVSQNDSRLILHENQSLHPIGSPGDFNDDRRINDADVDQLFAAIAASNRESRYDLNEDGRVNRQDADFLLYDVLGSSAGDANLDRKFDSADLVLVFQSGLYEKESEDPVGWAQGDWNGDGQFSSADLILALQSGSFVASAMFVL